MAVHYKRLRLSRCETRDEHRVVVERKLGRKLLSTEIVHHKNENKRDNAPENLELTTRSEHARHHMEGRILSESTKAALSLALGGKRQRQPDMLPDETVISIRRDRAAGIGPTELSKRYGVGKATVIQIANRQRYAYVA